MNVLFIGDVFGKPGRQLIKKHLHALQAKEAADFTIVNVENAAAGRGVTAEICEQLLEHDIDVLTSGNHIWRMKDILEYIDQNDRLLRPFNFPESNPGQGCVTVDARNGVRVTVANFIGRVYMGNHGCPFAHFDALLEQTRSEKSLLFVDFHAEATSEKKAFAWYADGKASAVFGTHTHVQTSDAQILEHGTAYITDAGMTGPHNSVIGTKKELSIRGFRSGMPVTFEPANSGCRLQGAVVDVDQQTARARNIRAIDLGKEELEALSAS